CRAEPRPPGVHALVHALTHAVGAHGASIELIEPPLLDPLGAGLPDLIAAIERDEVDAVVVADCTQVYAGGGRACPTSLPIAHSLEAWGDARAHDGTWTLIQPLIRPLHEGLSIAEL